jgi:hypothetical protein
MTLRQEDSMKRLLLLAFVSVVGLATWRWHSAAPTDATDDSKLALDRIWVDHMPRDDRDIFQIFLAITDEPFGVFQAQSVWKGNFELFRYELAGDKLRLVFPQNNDRETVTFRARKCEEKEMDYCLELSGSSRGAKRYYSRKGWEVGSLAGEQAKLREIAGAPQ